MGIGGDAVNAGRPPRTVDTGRVTEVGIGTAGPETTRDGRAGNVASHLVVAEDALDQAERLLHLQGHARIQFDLAESGLEALRGTMVRVAAGDIQPGDIDVPPPVTTIPTPMPRRSGSPFLVLAMLGCAAVAATTGLIVSLHAATSPGVPVPWIMAIAVTAADAASSASDEARPSGADVGVEVPTSIGRGDEDIGQYVYAAQFANAPAQERLCLARAIYHEARGETFDGQVAVAQVILNRVRSVKWPKTICGVVNQGVERGEKCQFSFACVPNLSQPSGDDWDTSQRLADQALNGQAWLRELRDAAYYHTTAVAPVWRLGVTRIGVIGTHIFYRDADGVRASAINEQDYLAAAGVAANRVLKPKAVASAKSKILDGQADAGGTKKSQGGSVDWAAGVFQH